MRKLTLFIVSDSVGETAELVAKAAVSQFRQGLETVSMKRFSHVEDETQLKEIAFLSKRARSTCYLYTCEKWNASEIKRRMCELEEFSASILWDPL